MKNQWMVLLTVLAFGVAACSGDANGEDDMAEMDDATEEMADDMGSDGMAEGMADEGAADAAAQELPEGVTMAMVDEGKTVFEGAGICSSCHGPAGAGIPNLGADLTDDEWTHSDGSYEGIVETVMTGVTAEASSTGVPMPAKAGTNITDAQVRAASAYVWTLGQ